MKKLILLLLEGCETLEFSPFIDVFGWNEIIGDKNIKIDICGIDGAITTSWGLKIIPNINFQNIKIDPIDYDGIIIPGGFGKYNYFNNLNNPILKNLLNDFEKSKKLIIGICTGSLILGSLGLLNGKLATTYLLDNERYFSQLKNYMAIPIKENMVICDNIITTSNPASATTVAFYLLELLTSRENMENIKRNMGF